MNAIRCACGKQVKNFERLSQKDLPKGWDCDDLCGPKEEKQPEIELKNEEIQEEAPKQEEPKEQSPREDRKNRRNKNKNKQE